MVKIIQNYTLHEQIGEGEYGKVYRGVDGRNGKQVAVKVINVRRFKDNPKLEECTLNQIEVLSKIDCPHIVRFIQILKTINNFYFFYQFCNGGTLDQEIRKQKYLTESKIVQYFQQLVEAFKVLTANNIMHRDLKPSNIMIHNGKIKLGDFGFCKSLQNHRDLAQTMLGSPIYMAPEVLRGQIYTIKADLWSLGVVLYEMAYGFCPYEESSIARLINLLEHRQLQFNRDINPISTTLQELLKRILVKDHFKRISWDQLFNYSIKNGKIMRNSQQNNSISLISRPSAQTHYRTLSQINRIPKGEAQIQITEKQNKTPPSDTKLFKKKKGEEDNLYHNGDLHQNLLQMVRVIDKLIADNDYPQITCRVALKCYKLILKQHGKLGNKRQYLKERTQLTEAVEQIQTLADEDQQIDDNSVFKFIKNKEDRGYFGLSKIAKIMQAKDLTTLLPDFISKAPQKYFGQIQLQKLNRV